MNGSPLVSIIMAVYNGEEFLGECIESFLHQEFNEFEFLIVDDASSDSTAEILAHYAMIDSRIKVLTNDINLERSYSRNRAIAFSRAPYIAVMDADDIAMPSRLALQYQFMEENTDVAVCGGNFEVYETGEVKLLPTGHEELSATLLFNSNIPHPTVMLRKKKLTEQHHCYSADLTPVEDYALWADILMTGCGKFANLPQVLLRYRTHPQKDRSAYHKHMSLQADKVRAELCCWFWGDDVTEDKIRLHCLSSDGRAASIEDLKSIADYLCSLPVGNARRWQLSQPHVEAVVCSQWEAVCQMISRTLFIKALACMPVLFRGCDPSTTVRLIKSTMRVARMRAVKLWKMLR